MSAPDTDARCANCAYFAGARPDEATGEIIGDCRYGSWPPVRPASSWCRDHVPKGALHTPRGQAAFQHARARAESKRATIGGALAHSTFEELSPDAQPSASTRAPSRREPTAYEKVAHVPVPRAPIDIEVDDMDEATFRAILREILADELGLQEAPIGERWRGGELILKPGREGTQEKRVPIERFFHKVIMVRDKLRLLEQKVNTNAALAAEDKVTLQQYVTACYGSLTTFNVLFADEADRFVGQAGDKD